MARWEVGVLPYGGLLVIRHERHFVLAGRNIVGTFALSRFAAYRTITLSISECFLQGSAEMMPRMVMWDFVIVISTCFFGCEDAFAQFSDIQENSDAKNEAETFLDLLKNEDGESAFTMLSKDFRERLSESQREAKSFDVNVFDGMPIDYYLIQKEESSASRNRHTLRGTLNRLKGSQTRDFILVMVKQDGDWRVDVFSVKKK